MDNSRVPLPVDEATVENQDKALAVVQRLLKERGVRSRRHHRISLGVYANRPDDVVRPGGPSSLSWTDRYPPELVVTDPRGRRKATVTVEPRSGRYLLSLRDDPGLRRIERQEPERVVELIAGPEAGA